MHNLQRSLNDINDLFVCCGTLIRRDNQKDVSSSTNLDELLKNITLFEVNPARIHHSFRNPFF